MRENVIKWPPHDKPNKMTVRTAKTEICLGIRPVWSESLLCAQWVANDPSFLHADSEGSDHTGRMPRLIWVFAGRTCHLVGFVMRRLICLFYVFNSITVSKIHQDDGKVIMKDTVQGRKEGMTDSWYEPPHDKTNKMTCAPNEDSDQPEHPPRLCCPHEETLGP